ncbi:DUF4124 domain-containing protein [Desulfatirhabdium butyrativorans]|uniref:DUF4124 domain-containing protein n=1 Tax=Desulfatirhabdium butyrativorans TaxID=340467 RepID=UPI00146F9F56|nr:DUF4124 domain-containing protein [Desulfatirhabdium butyrativorans]
MTIRFLCQSVFWGSILWMWVASAGAQIYRYVDPSGTVRFTDNLQDVPEAQRKGATAIPEEQPSTTPPSPKQSRPIQSDSAAPDKVQAKPAGGADNAPASFVEQAERLKKEQSEMDQEYIELVREQAALADQRSKVRDSESMTRYNEQVDSLNQKTDQYEKRRQALQQKMDAFNERLREHLDTTAAPPGKTSGAP